MRVTTLLSALCAIPVAFADPRTVQIHVQPLTAPPVEPAPLAEVSYDPLVPDSSSIVAYEAPEIPESADLVRVGVYDPKSSRWISGATVASAENFSKGYAPTLMLTVDSRGGDVLSAACKGVRIDAGQTRDFGPRAVVLVEARGKQPELNKPVVLSPEGKKVEEQEKTFLQKYAAIQSPSCANFPWRTCSGLRIEKLTCDRYWWMLAIAAFVIIGGGGGDK